MRKKLCCPKTCNDVSVANKKGTTSEYMKDHIFKLWRKIYQHSYANNLSSCEIKAWKNLGLNGIRTHDLCNTGAALYQQSYQSSWELVTLWICNMPLHGEEYKWTYERSYIFELVYCTYIKHCWHLIAVMQGLLVVCLIQLIPVFLPGSLQCLAFLYWYIFVLKEKQITSLQSESTKYVNHDS